MLAILAIIVIFILFVVLVAVSLKTGVDIKASLDTLEHRKFGDRYDKKL